MFKAIPILLLGILPAAANAADQCAPVNNFIDLGKSAEKCVAEINLGKQKAGDVLTSFGFCTNVRDARDDVEQKLNQLPTATMNRCAEKQLQAYTDAATAFQRLYQIELRLQ